MVFLCSLFAVVSAVGGLKVGLAAVNEGNLNST